MAGQKKICSSSVLCIGAGGLGSPIAMYLAAAGIGKMPVARSIPNIDHRFGNGEAVLLGVELLDGSGNVISEVEGGQANRAALAPQGARSLCRL